MKRLLRGLLSFAIGFLLTFIFGNELAYLFNYLTFVGVIPWGK